MIKVYFAVGFSCLALGSLGGYCIEHLTRQPAPAIASAPPPPKPLTRPELESRFTLCIGKPLSLAALSDKALNDSVAQCESLKAKS